MHPVLWLLLALLQLSHSLPVSQAELKFNTASLDEWARAGHGNLRMKFSGEGLAYSKQVIGTSGCTYATFGFPSTGQSPGGAQLRSDGIIHIPALCQSQAHLFAVNATSGELHGSVNSYASSWDTPVVYLPSGDLVLGTNKTSISIFDGMSLVHKVTSQQGLVGAQGARAMTVTKTHPAQLYITGGGSLGWWASACDIVGDHHLERCEKNADTSLIMGADGATMYNNHLQGNDISEVLRFKLPFPGAPEVVFPGFVAWPWWVRTDLCGAVYLYSFVHWTGTGNLSKYDADNHLVWNIPDMNFPDTGLFLTDDETTVVLATGDEVVTYDAGTGAKKKHFAMASVAMESCRFVHAQPWTLPLPVLLPDSRHAVFVCTPTSNDAQEVILVADLAAGRFLPGTVPVDIPIEQVLVDDSGRVYILGHNDTSLHIQRLDPVCCHD